MSEPMKIFALGTRVVKTGGDYTFDGVVVACFKKKSGAWRYVVENDAGLLHIFSAHQLEKAADGQA